MSPPVRGDVTQQAGVVGVLAGAVGTRERVRESVHVTTTLLLGSRFRQLSARHPDLVRL